MLADFTRKGAALLASAMMLFSVTPVRADTEMLPGVTPGMTDPMYWAAKSEASDAVLADRAEIEALNAAVLACPECCMTDLRREYPAYDGEALKRELTRMAKTDLAGFLVRGYYDASGQPAALADFSPVLHSIEDAEAEPSQQVRYGICVEVADVRALPTDRIITDSAGDIDFDVLQLSNLRVNEPVVIRAQTAGGGWCYCDSACVSGWVPSGSIAVCAGREEWLNAWQIPEEELLVVTGSRLYLDRANVNAASSERKLTMGTTLRRVSEEDYDAAVTNRAAYHNYPVWLPVRAEDGSYTVTIALIPERSDVSEGFLPLTEENILRTAFSALGDAYGWGGMLNVPDCSLLVRNVYKCFGLEIPRNTTWQSAMPARQEILSGRTSADKAALLDTLPAGTILFFKGHEMLYLGREGDRHYVLSSVSSIMAPEGRSVLRLRSVVINTLEDTLRASGKTWLEDLDLALFPCLTETEGTAEDAA